ncbi:MAG TPA: hypothetical protein VHD84_02085 [Candidatus Saccharimonadales bacterium]|nr:hypothetical protein [Candidatus Saccharimonadales bacterium]
MPALLGLRMGQTIIFGHKIHPPIQKGLTLERTEAKECTAEILDKRTKKHLAPLWWRVLDSDRMVSTVDIPSGKNAELMLFAQKDENSARYFIYKPISESDHSMVVPPDGAMYTRTKSFLIVISSYGRRKWMFETAVTIMPDGKVTYRVK